MYHVLNTPEPTCAPTHPSEVLVDELELNIVGRLSTPGACPCVPKAWKLTLDDEPGQAWVLERNLWVPPGNDTIGLSVVAWSDVPINTDALTTFGIEFLYNDRNTFAWELTYNYPEYFSGEGGSQEYVPDFVESDVYWQLRDCRESKIQPKFYALYSPKTVFGEGEADYHLGPNAWFQCVGKNTFVLFAAPGEEIDLDESFQIARIEPWC